MTEDHIEQHALETLKSLGWGVLHGPEIGPEGSGGGSIRMWCWRGDCVGHCIG